jgi:aminoglycoside phosphotransferase (APT) family kinase protein
MIELALRTTRFHRLLKRIQRPWVRYLERKTLGRYSVVARDLLARLQREGNGELGAATPRIVRALRTRSDVVVVLLSDVPSGAITKVLKLPLTPRAEQSTANHRQVVMTLHQTAELKSFTELVPKALSWGEYAGQSYYLETALEGANASDVVRKHLDTPQLLREAIAAIQQLHLPTARCQIVDEVVFKRLAGDHLAALRRLAARATDPVLLDRKLGALEAMLRRELIGRELPFCWTHGDFWPGNILVRPSDGAVSGIVDWDRAVVGQLPLVDVLHLLAYTRKMRRRTALGEEVVGYLLPAAFTAEERALVDQSVERLALPKGEAFLRAATMLYWLQFAATNLTRYPSFAHDRDWMRDNVVLVLKRGLP